MNIKIFGQEQPHLKKITVCGFPKLTDYKCFTHAIIKKSDKPFHWTYAENYNQLDPPVRKLVNLRFHGTTAFLVIKDNQLIYEKYFSGFTKDSVMNSFSMAKTITAILLGIAIEKGYIKSLDDKVADYLPDMNFVNSNYGQKLTIRHLLTMTSGSSWNEQFVDPLSDVVSAYYSDTLEHILQKIKIIKKPGTRWKYQCGNTILLGLIVQHATNMPLPQFAEKYLWQPLGANHDAYWNTDSTGITKAFCCFYATPRDFALIGLMLLNNGQFNGHQILPQWYVKEMTTPYKKARFRFRKVDFYGLQTWIYPKADDVFYLAGMLGQYVIFLPKYNAVIVRMGQMPNQLTIRRIPPDFEFYYKLGLEILKIYQKD